MTEQNDDLNEIIKNTATGPKKVKSEIGEVENFTLQELIEADKYLNKKKAGNNVIGNIGFVKFNPDGTN